MAITPFVTKDASWCENEVRKANFILDLVFCWCFCKSSRICITAGEKYLPKEWFNECLNWLDDIWVLHYPAEPSSSPLVPFWLAGISRGMQVFVVWYQITTWSSSRDEKKNPPLVTSSVNGSWVGRNECFHSVEMGWRGSMTSELREVRWGCFSATGWWGDPSWADEQTNR